MPLFIGDYLADTMHLSAEEHGAYLLLLMHYWRMGPLPDSPLTLAKICRLSGDAWSNAWGVLKEFFVIGADGRLHQRRIDKELAEAGQRREKSRSRAERAAEARWRPSGGSSSSAPSILRSMPEECPSPSSSPLHREQQQTLVDPGSTDELPSGSAGSNSGPKLARSRTPAIPDEMLETIYQAYPRREKPKPAKQAIRKALLDIMGGVHCQPLEMPQAFDSLLQTTQMYANSKRVRRLQAAGEARYISHPATWFNAEEYLVDPAVWESDERRNG